MHAFDGFEIKKPDPQGRINIGREHANELFAIEKQPNGDIVLHPVAVIHKREAWLFENPEALAAVREGLAQSAAGETENLGTFAEFADEEE